MFLRRAPPADLAPHIQCFWGLQAAAGTLPVERVIPDGRCELVLHLAGRFERQDAAGRFHRQPAAFVFGQIQHAILIRPEGQVDLFAVRFTTTGLAGLFGLNVARLGATEVELEALGLHDLEWERLCAAHFEERCALVATWLRRQRVALPDLRLVQAGLAGLRMAGATIGQLALELGVGRRRLERAMQQSVGLSPGAWWRLCRLREGAQALRQPGISIAQIAGDCGFADQAHFTRHFREVVGISPGAYRRELRAGGGLIG